LGPSPAEFKVHRPSSYMGDDCTPIEFSWAVSADGIQTIRFTMEPLSPDDGTPTPGSTWLSSLESLHSYAPSTNFDLTWSKICHQTVVKASCGVSSDDGGSQHNSQFSIGADFTRSGHITGKSYFLPHMRSKAEGVSCSALVTGCMLQLGLEQPWSAVHEYLKTLPLSLETIPEIVSVDCLEP
ncbi:aromatic prenyltransferase, partial [Mycena filopes]